MAPRIPYLTAARTLLRDSVMGAVGELVRGRGWPSTTMADVAQTAGVSRQTLYNEFGSRQALVEAYATREIDALLVSVDAAVRAHRDDAHLALRTAFELFLQLASDEPVVQLIVAGSDSGELMRVLTQVGQTLAGERVAALVREVWPQVGVDDARVLAGSLARLAISHALLPTGDRASAAADVSRMLAPYVDELWAEPVRRYIDNCRIGVPSGSVTWIRAMRSRRTSVPPTKVISRPGTRRQLPTS